MLRIIDISAFQVAKSPTGADVVICKATEGSRYSSSAFSKQFADAKKKAQLQGAYHFARPEESSGSSQADRFLSMVRPTPTTLLCLDLEASKLTQAKTNSWAKDFAERIRAKQPLNPLVLYMGSAYASNGTGKGLSEFFDLWWYPQYPGAYQLSEQSEQFWRMLNRTHYTQDLLPVSSKTSMWPDTFIPWLPKGLTCGWSEPHLWQFTDNYHSDIGAVDASISRLTVSDILNSGPMPASTGEDTWFLGI